MFSIIKKKFFNFSPQLYSCSREKTVRGHAVEEILGERREEHVRRLRGDRGVLGAARKRAEQRLRLCHLCQQAIGHLRHKNPSSFADHGGKQRILYLVSISQKEFFSLLYTFCANMRVCRVFGLFFICTIRDFWM